MAIHDHIKPGLDARVMAKIVTVDPAQRKIEAALKDGGLIHIAVFDSPSVFVWPQQGEHWTVRKDSGIWRLDKRVDSNDEHKIDNINPGEAKIYADTITNMSGHKIAAVNTVDHALAENAVLVYQGNSWVPITGPQFESITVKKDDDHYVEIRSTADIHVLNGAITMKSDDSNFINARATGDLSLLNGYVLISGDETVSYTPKIIDKIEANTPINDPPKYVTYTCYNHGLTAGQVASILDADVAGFNGSFVVHSVTNSTFTVANRTVGDGSGARLVYADDNYTQVGSGGIYTTGDVSVKGALTVDGSLGVDGDSYFGDIYPASVTADAGGFVWADTIKGDSIQVYQGTDPKDIVEINKVALNSGWNYTRWRDGNSTVTQYDLFTTENMNFGNAGGGSNVAYNVSSTYSTPNSTINLDDYPYFGLTCRYNLVSGTYGVNATLRKESSTTFRLWFYQTNFTPSVGKSTASVTDITGFSWRQIMPAPYNNEKYVYDLTTQERTFLTNVTVGKDYADISGLTAYCHVSLIVYQ